MRGPAPTPTPILKARDSWRANERTGEVQFPEGAPPCPAFLNREAKAEWRRQVKQLQAAGILCQVDRAALACWCEAWAEFVEIREAIETILTRQRDLGENATSQDVQREIGYVVAINAGLLNAKNKAVDRLLRLAQQFGFSPSARARIKGPQLQEQTSGTGKARFFAG